MAQFYLPITSDQNRSAKHYTGLQSSPSYIDQLDFKGLLLNNKKMLIIKTPTGDDEKTIKNIWQRRVSCLALM